MLPILFRNILFWKSFFFWLVKYKNFIGTTRIRICENYCYPWSFYKQTKVYKEKLTRGVNNINPLSKHSFRNFLHKRKKLLIALFIMGFGVFMVGQTVPNNFFKKIFSPQKTSVAKDSAGTKHRTSSNRVLKKPVAFSRIY